jgi:hypothetical protein
VVHLQYPCYVAGLLTPERKTRYFFPEKVWSGCLDPMRGQLASQSILSSSMLGLVAGAHPPLIHMTEHPFPVRPEL